MKRVLHGTMSNLESIGWDVSGKPSGQLSPMGKSGIELFMRYNKVNRRYTEELVGKEQYKTLDEVQFAMTEAGFTDMNEAVRLVNKKNSLNLPPDAMQMKLSEVRKATEAVFHQDGGFFSRKWDWAKTLWGNDIPNLSVVGGMLRKRAELLVHAGVEPEQAIKSSITYLSDPHVTTKINNTLYLNTQLPAVPQGENVATWMERYRKDVAVVAAESNHLDTSHVILTPTGDGSLMATNGAGIPIHGQNGERIEITKGDFSKWIVTKMAEDRSNKVKTENNRRDDVKRQGEEFIDYARNSDGAI